MASSTATFTLLGGISQDLNFTRKHVMGPIWLNISKGLGDSKVPWPNANNIWFVFCSSLGKYNYISKGF